VPAPKQRARRAASTADAPLGGDQSAPAAVAATSGKQTTPRRRAATKQAADAAPAETGTAAEPLAAPVQSAAQVDPARPSARAARARRTSAASTVPAAATAAPEAPAKSTRAPRATAARIAADTAPAEAAPRVPRRAAATSAAPVDAPVAIADDAPVAAPRRARVAKPAAHEAPAAVRPAPAPVAKAAPAVQRATPRKATRTPAAFAALGLSEQTLFAIEMLRFEKPTPIQQRAIPILLTGRDVVGRAQTGTGKTLAFAAPIADRMDTQNPATQAIVLVPTRELAEQVATQTASVCGGRGLTVVPLIGGRRLQADFAALKGRPQIVVGTPGRVIDHLRRGTLQLGAVRFVVLDEADEMLDIGFADDIETILRRTPRQRQTALFSATLPAFLKRMIARYLHDPAYVAIEPEKTTVAAIEQVYFEVAERDKSAALIELLGRLEMTRVLCFRRTQIGVDKLAADLKRRGVSALGIHGGLNQRERDRVMKAFRAGEIRVLIATNVAARGLDIPDVTHVVNYDLPQNTEEYVHRTGRTGRAGRAGMAVTFIAEWDYEGLPVLQRFVGDALKRGTLDLYER
jgi:superfamily II DNA/RNA helicase